MMNNIAIIVVTYNRIELLKEVIESLKNQSFKNYQIIVVNNGSTDSTLEWLNSQNDVVTINQDNVGGAGGFYSGIKYAVENGYDYCWIMDDDVICSPTALEELYAAYTSQPNIGFVCSRVLGIDGNPMNTPFADMRPSENGYSDIFDLVVSHSMVKVKNATFVSVFFSTKIVKEVGLPYKEFFIWGDDTEYTGRISSKYPCYVACKSLVTHKRSLQANLEFMQESDPKRLKNYFYYYRNNMFIIKKTQGKKVFRQTWNSNFYFAIRRFLRGDKAHSSVLFRALKDVLSFNPQIVTCK